MTIVVTMQAVHRNQRIGHERAERFDTLDDAKHFVRTEFRGWRSRGPIYVDTKSRGTIQCGRMYTRRGEATLWITFERIVSETDRLAESVDLKGEKL